MAVDSPVATLDPIRFEVIRNALLATTEEMAATLRRSAYSTNIKTRADFSCCFFDRELRSVAQAFSQPVHLGSLVHLVPNAVRSFGVERLRAGDMLVVNNPYLGSIHLNDIAIIAPVYVGDRLVGYLANIAHHVDVGGGAPASVAAFREIFQEGVMIPPVRLVADGQLVDDVFQLILGQIRSKHETAGDFRAQIAANISGRRRLMELIERNGVDMVNAYIDELIEYTARRTRAELRRLPRGTFRAECTLDSDGFTDQPVQLCLSITIADGGVVFDLAGSDPQRRAPVNASFGPTYSACAYSLKALLDPDLPVNQGFYDLVEVRAPRGTVVNVAPPAPAVGGGEVQIRVSDLVFKALATAMPDAVPAGCKAMQCHAGFGGTDPLSGEYYCFLETLAGGYGGRVASDGPDAVQSHGQNTENAPIEETEANYPVRITRYELVPDSEGPGRYRGGLGLRRDYAFSAPETTFTVLADRERAGPWGLFGGLAGRPAEYILNPDGEARRLGSKVTIDLHAGDVVSYRTCGGGGYGPPFTREAELVLKDVREGKVSVQRARDLYGVAINSADWTVDAAETLLLRSRLAAGEQNA